MERTAEQIEKNKATCKLWNAAHVESQKEKRAELRRREPIFVCSGIIFRGARSRAKRDGRALDLTIEWVTEKVAHGTCEVTGLPFDLFGDHRNGRYHSPWAPSIDRINCDLGYTTDNCQVVVYLYNTAKLNTTHEEFMTLVKALSKPLFKKALETGRISIL